MLVTKELVEGMVKEFRSRLGWSKVFADRNLFDYNNNFNAQLQYAVIQTALIRENVRALQQISSNLVNSTRLVEEGLAIWTMMDYELKSISVVILVLGAILGGILIHKKMRNRMRVQRIEAHFRGISAGVGDNETSSV